nr:hypothetical protein Iba_chr04bCG1300 [Ipomoea batatas]
MGLSHGISTCHSEKTGSSNYSDFTNRVHSVVDAQHAKRASIVFTLREGVAEGQDEAQIFLPNFFGHRSNVVANNSIPIGGIKGNGVCDGISACQTEQTGTSHYSHFTDRVHRRVNAEKAERAPGVIAVGEGVAHGHDEAQDWTAAEVKEWVPNYSNPLSLQTIVLQKLSIAPCGDELLCCSSCFGIVVVEAYNSIKNMSSI